MKGKFKQHRATPRSAGLLAAGLLLGAACMAQAQSAATAYLILNDQRQVDGTAVRVNAQGDYVIRTEVGERTFPAAQVLEAVGEKPAEFDRAVAALRAGQVEQAVPVLERIAQQNRRLGWDDEANTALGRAFLRGQDPQRAAAALEKISEPFLSRRPDVRVALWDALIGAGRGAVVEPLLDEAIRGGDRALAAQAQIRRGDLKMSRRQVEEAAMDYLRTVILFESQRAAQPEALFKAGTALRELRDPRAARLFETLSKEYADSEFAARIP